MAEDSVVKNVDDSDYEVGKKYRLVDIMRQVVVKTLDQKYGLKSGEILSGEDLELGFNVPYNVGSGLILSAPAPDAVRDESSSWSFYVLAGVESKSIFHDTAIEGGLFRDSPYTLDAEPWVGEFHWGAGVQYKAIMLEYANVLRTKEFETNERRPNYGRIAVTWNF